MKKEKKNRGYCFIGGKPCLSETRYMKKSRFLIGRKLEVSIYIGMRWDYKFFIAVLQACLRRWACLPPSLALISIATCHRPPLHAQTCHRGRPRRVRSIAKGTWLLMAATPPPPNPPRHRARTPSMVRMHPSVAVYARPLRALCFFLCRILWHGFYKNH